MLPRILLLLSLSLGLSLSACVRRELTPAEKLVGSWQIANVPEIQKHFSMEIKLAKMTFEDGGKLLCDIGNKVETGRWEVDDLGTILSLKADSVAFNDPLKLLFEDERTIYIENNGLRFLFKKI